MKPQTLVKSKKTGKLGVVVRDDFPMGNVPGSVAVVFDGQTYYQETMPDELEVIGVEQPVADFSKCGGGKGGECCIFLTAGPDGFGCDRFTTLRNSIIFKAKMVAKRHPARLYPNCQLVSEDGKVADGKV